MRWRLAPRFGLRALLLVVTLAALALGLVLERARRQREAIAQLEQAGAQIIYQHQAQDRPPPGPVWLRERLGTQFFSAVNTVHFEGDVSPETLAALARLPAVERLTLEQTTVNDDHVRAIARIRGLKWLSISTDTEPFPAISRAGWEALSQSRDLEALQILNVDARAGALDLVARLERLTYLNLYGWQLKPGDLAHLRKLTRLAEINLNASTATGEDLPELVGMDSLRRVHAGTSNFPPAARAELQRTLLKAAVTN